FFFYRSAHHRALHSFPTRRSSDLTDVAVIGEVHYTGSLGSGEFHGEEIDWASNVFVSTPAGGSLDMVNLTGGLHLQFGPQMSLRDRKSTRLNSSHVKISYAVFCLK